MNRPAKGCDHLRFRDILRGLLVEFEPRERHEVTASSDARLLLLLTPWPGDGHPGAMEIREKLYTRRHAAKRSE